MADEIGQVTQGQSDSDSANESTAAAAAFIRSRSGDTPHEPEVEIIEEVRKDPEPAAPAKVLAGLTEKEIGELLGEIPKYRKQIDNLAGNNGKLNAALQKLQQETLRGEAVTVTDDDMKEMGEAFPELANMTKGALNKALARLNLKGTSSSQTPDDYIALARKEAEAVASSERIKTHAELLSGLNPGWEKIVGLPVNGMAPDNEYRRWLASQPADYKDKIDNSNNAFEIGASIKAFNEAKEASAKRQQQNKQRLANAVQPSGQVSARTSISEQSAADKAFQASRQR